jgi:hypothetical protein
VKKVILQISINHGFLKYLAIIVYVALAVHIRLLILLRQYIVLGKNYPLLASIIPTLLLAIMLRRPLKNLIRPDQIIVYSEGIEIHSRFFKWNTIKSISFKTNRFKRPFSKSSWLPAYQELYLLDNKGKEYAFKIDIDYWMKKNRDDNNTRRVSDALVEAGQVAKLSDWAEKR